MVERGLGDDVLFYIWVVYCLWEKMVHVNVCWESERNENLHLFRSPIQKYSTTVPAFESPTISHCQSCDGVYTWLPLISTTSLCRIESMRMWLVAVLTAQWIHSFIPIHIFLSLLLSLFVTFSYSFTVRHWRHRNLYRKCRARNSYTFLFGSCCSYTIHGIEIMFVVIGLCATYRVYINSYKQLVTCNDDPECKRQFLCELSSAVERQTLNVMSKLHCGMQCNYLSLCVRRLLHELYLYMRFWMFTFHFQVHVSQSVQTRAQVYALNPIDNCNRVNTGSFIPFSIWTAEKWSNHMHTDAHIRLEMK